MPVIFSHKKEDFKDDSLKMMRTIETICSLNQTNFMV